MAVINSLALYFLLLTVMTYLSNKMKYYKCETNTANEEHTGLVKIIKSFDNGVTGRSLLAFLDNGNFPEHSIDYHEAASKISEDVGSDDTWRPIDDAISGRPITQSSSLSFINSWGPRTYEQVSPLSSDDVTTSRPASSPTKERRNQTPQTDFWAFSLRLFKHTTKSYLLVFDENGIMRSNVTIHQPHSKPTKQI